MLPVIEPMADDPKEPRIRHGVLLAAAYVAFAVALYVVVVYGWPWLTRVMPSKFWAVF